MKKTIRWIASSLMLLAMTVIMLTSCSDKSVSSGSEPPPPCTGPDCVSPVASQNKIVWEMKSPKTLVTDKTVPPLNYVRDVYFSVFSLSDATMKKITSTIQDSQIITRLGLAPNGDFVFLTKQCLFSTNVNSEKPMLKCIIPSQKLAEMASRMSIDEVDLLDFAFARQDDTNFWLSILLSTTDNETLPYVRQNVIYNSKTNQFTKMPMTIEFLAYYPAGAPDMLYYRFSNVDNPIIKYDPKNEKYFLMTNYEGTTSYSIDAGKLYKLGNMTGVDITDKVAPGSLSENGLYGIVLEQKLDGTKKEEMATINECAIKTCHIFGVGDANIYFSKKVCGGAGECLETPYIFNLSEKTVKKIGLDSFISTGYSSFPFLKGTAVGDLVVSEFNNQIYSSLKDKIISLKEMGLVAGSDTKYLLFGASDNYYVASPEDLFALEVGTIDQTNAVFKKIYSSNNTASLKTVFNDYYVIVDDNKKIVYGKISDLGQNQTTIPFSEEQVESIATTAVSAYVPTNTAGLFDISTFDINSFKCGGTAGVNAMWCEDETKVCKDGQCVKAVTPSATICSTDADCGEGKFCIATGTICAAKVGVQAYQEGEAIYDQYSARQPFIVKRTILDGTTFVSDTFSGLCGIVSNAVGNLNEKIYHVYIGEEESCLVTIFTSPSSYVTSTSDGTPFQYYTTDEEKEKLKTTTTLEIQNPGHCALPGYHLPNGCPSGYYCDGDICKEGTEQHLVAVIYPKITDLIITKVSKKDLASTSFTLKWNTTLPYPKYSCEMFADACPASEKPTGEALARIDSTTNSCTISAIMHLPEHLCFVVTPYITDNSSATGGLKAISDKAAMKSYPVDSL